MAKKYLMGLDRGSTNIKAAIYDFEGKEIFISGHPCEPVRQPHLGWVEQDMNLLWENAKVAIHNLFKNSDIKPEEIAAIGFSGHGSGVYLIDHEGRPARAAIMSMDNRVFYEDQERIKRGEKPEYEGLNAPDPAALVKWVKLNEPEVYQKTRWIMASKDWMRFCMTGEAHVSRSEFGMSSFMDDKTKEYDFSVCDRLGIPEAKEMLPSFVRAWEVCGHVTEKAAAETGLVAGTPCVAGGHDCALGSFGVGGYQTGHLTAILGTFAMNMLVGKPDFFEIPEGSYGSHGHSVLRDQWLFMNNSMTGRGLDWFIDNFCDYERLLAKEKGISVHQYIEEMGNQAQPSELIYHPYILPGRGSLTKARVGLYGANMFTTRNEIMRAVFEGIAFGEVEALAELQRITEITSLTMTGGGSKNELWGQIFSDLLDLPVIIPDLKEAGCRGAALLAGIGIGVFKDHEEAATIPLKIRRSYEPGSPMKAEMQHKYGKFMELVDCNLPYWNSL